MRWPASSAGRGVGLVLAGSSAAVVIAYVIRFLAIAIGFAQAGFARISTELDEVARMLGAGPGRWRARSICRWPGRRSWARRC